MPGATASGTRIEPRTRQAGPETVLVIGGGATGIVTLRNLVEERGRDSQGSYPLFEPLLVERRDDVGGVWYWSDETYALERTIGPDKVQGLSPVFDPKGTPHWPSPAYLNLRGNVLPEFLEFRGKKFDPPANGETFPSMSETHNYLKSYAQPYRKYIKCGVEVLRVQELPADQGWQVTLKHWSSSAVPKADAVSFTPSVEVRTFDRVVVAAGWYDTPFYPDVPGIQLAKERGHVHHCKHYRDSTPYIGKKVVVVGNNNSANEVAAHLAPFNSVSHPVYKSAKSAPIDKCPALPDARIKDVGLITNYQLVHTAADGSREKGTKLDLTLADGSVIRNVDYVILGTGYGQKYPWLYVLTDAARQNGSSAEVEQLTPDSLKGTRVPHMYNHALYAKSPRLTLGFVGLLISYTPFAYADLNSAWIVAVWAGKITSVPRALDARLQYERDRMAYLYETRSKKAAEKGEKLDAHDPATYAYFHAIAGARADGPPSESHFAEGLYEELMQADPDQRGRWLWKWDDASEEKRISMYRRKKEWLEENGDRIRHDPFDLMGSNNVRYGHLVDELVDARWRARKQNAPLATVGTGSAAERPQTNLDLWLSFLPRRAQKPAWYAVMGTMCAVLFVLLVWLLICFVELAKIGYIVLGMMLHSS
ncbi:related to FMO1-flavin-containing monooxygenase [Sporisorium reilianum f. sp. reilianum]|uniref:Related to FMO1-flavin-containing monooxygenase n=1 Tax=Sporisorium reilianum f. sp. reilianum TaxID=72559 RepID=A0A2N8U993_9BASI|nr:related to FMO1-flavin-containing monooxygenase [Sporisorium reilianum f. sp. reilianum]